MMQDASKSSVDALAPVYAASYDHLGIILWGAEEFEKHLDIELERLEKFPGFRIGWDHEAWTYDYLAEHAPHVLDRLRSALAQYKGRLGCGSSTYGQPLSMYIDGESNIRQLTLAMDATEKQLGYPMSVYIMSEHPFHAQLPQLLVGAGFKGCILRTHLMMYGHNPEIDEPVVWWTGIDGTSIPSLPTFHNHLGPVHVWYKIGGPIYTLDGRILTDYKSDYCDYTLLRYRQRFGDRIRPLIATRANDCRSREDIISVHQNDPDYRWILIEDIFRLLPQPRVELRAAPNEFRGRMPWGYCGNWMWIRCRQAEVGVETAERLAAIGHALGGPAYEAEIEQAWKGLCVAQHHDIQICGLEDDARQRLGVSLAASQKVTDWVMAAITPRIGKGKRTVVFNPLPWARRDLLQTPAGEQLVTVPGLGFCAVSDRAIPVPTPPFVWEAQATEQPTWLRHRVRKHMDLGMESAWEKDAVGRLLTPFYEVYPHQGGGFRMIRSRRTGRDLMTPPKDSGKLVGMINDHYRESQGAIVGASISAHKVVLLEQGEIGGIPYAMNWTFYAHSPRIDWHCDLTLDNQWIGRARIPVAAGAPAPEQAEGDRPETTTAWNDHEHKLRLRFYPFIKPWATGVRDLPFHIAETSDPYVEGLTWGAVTDGEVGLAFLNRGLMGSIREKDDSFSNILAFSLPYVWGTRPLRGTYRYDLAILPFEGPWQEANLHKLALEYNAPVISRSEEVQGDPLGDAWTPYQETGDGRALLSALYTKNGATYARFYEYQGQTADVGVNWMGRAARLTSVNLREQRQARLGARARLGPWQVQTLELEGT